MEEYRHYLLQHNLTLQIYWGSIHDLLDCTLQLDKTFLSLINPLNETLHSPITLEWNWNPQSLSPSIHTLEVTVVYNHGEVKRSWNERLLFDLSTVSYIQIPKQMEENVKELQFKQPLRCVWSSPCSDSVFMVLVSIQQEFKGTTLPMDSTSTSVFLRTSAFVCTGYAFIVLWNLSVWKYTR